MIKNPKFYDFPPQTKLDWEERVKKELHGKNLEEALHTVVWDKLILRSFYTKEDLPETVIPTIFHPSADLPDTPPRIWENLVSIFPKEERETNEEILNALQNGAEGIVLHLDASEDLNQLLKDVHTEFIQLFILPAADTGPVLNQLRDWLDAIHLKPGMLRGGILWSPTDALFSGTKDFSHAMAIALESFELFKEFPDFSPICIDLAKYANTGANGLQQLIVGLGEIIEIIDHFIKKGISARTVFERSTLHLAAANAHFPEIAKLKAVRKLFKGLAHTYGVPINSEKIPVIVSTCTWSKSLADKNTNLIRQTYEALAAVLGGCNCLWVRPIEEEKATVQEKRTARNISNILREECYLNKVMDPAAGSYYLENLQLEIEKKVIAGLQKLEEEGGWLKKFEERKLHAEIRQTRETLQKKVLDGKEIRVGVNKYQPAKNQLREIKHKVVKEQDFELLPSRESYLIEIQNRKNP